MAACGGIEHIFEKPLLPETPTFLEVLSPWKHIKSMKPIDDTSFEIFGELHFKENHVHSHPSSSAVGEIPAADQERERGHGHRPSSSERKKQYRRNESTSSDSLSLCTEGLGFESFDDVEEMLSHDLCSDREWQRNVSRNSQPENHRGEAAAARTSRGEFPPPISSIGRSGKPWSFFKSYREDGRFVLKEIRIPTQEFLHACRQDGRLKMHFINSDDDEILQEGDEEEEDDAEEQNQEQGEGQRFAEKFTAI